MTHSAPSAQTNTRYVLVFWNDHFQDPSTITFVDSLKNKNINVKVIDAANTEHARYKHRSSQSPLSTDATLEEALALLPDAACIVFPHNLRALDLVLAHPKYEQFTRKAAENDAHFVGYIEFVAQFALGRTAEKSFDWIYPRDDAELDAFLNNVVRMLEEMLK